MSIRRVKRMLRPVAEVLVSTFGPHRWSRREARLLVLTYHRVLPAGHPEWSMEQPGMMVTPESLRLQLNVLREYFEFVHLDDWLSLARSGGDLPMKACAITFDDGWRDNYEHAWPILEETGVPATVFLVTSLVGTGASFWPNRLARLCKQRGAVLEIAKELSGESRHERESVRLLEESRNRPLTMDDVDALIERFKTIRSDEEIHELLDEVEARLESAPPGPRDLLSWDEVREMARSGLVRFGSHTCTHTRLTHEVSDERLKIEIRDSKLRLEAELDAECKLFCYPNGDLSPKASGEVRAEYLGAVSTSVGWNDRTCDPYSIRRIGIHEDVANGVKSFEARLSGWL